MFLKIFDKEGYSLELTLQMQRNNRVGIHHGELNSRLAWESVNKTRPAGYMENSGGNRLLLLFQLYEVGHNH